MNIRENALAVLRREKPEHLPLLVYDNIMPRGAFERELRKKGLGICRQRNEYWMQLQDVTTETRSHGGYTTTFYHTPYGTVSTKVRTCLPYGYGGQIRRRATPSGGHLIDPKVRQPGWMVKTEADYDAAIYLIKDPVVRADDTPYLDARRDTGDEGVVIGSRVTTPYEAAMEFLGPRRWVREEYEHPREFDKLVQACERKTGEICEVIADSPSEIVLMGTICEPHEPAQFRKYCLPFFQKYSHIMHRKGKIVGCRALSLWLKPIASLIAKTGLDFIEAFTPPPAGDLPLPEARAEWGEKTVIWVNFPETVFWSGWRETQRYAEKLIRSYAPGDRLIMGLVDLGSSIVIDSTTRDVLKTGLSALTDAVNETGAYPVLKG